MSTHSTQLVEICVSRFSVFMIIILVFRVSVLSPKLHALVFALQNLAGPVNMRILVASEQYFAPLDIFAFQTMSVLYGVWNLDFFRTILNGVCLNISTLQVLALDYLVAVYPMLMMAIAYVLVELHAMASNLCSMYGDHFTISLLGLEGSGTSSILSSTRLSPFSSYEL